jgi:hypothetical protein
MRIRIAALTTVFLLALGVPATASAQFSMGVGGGPAIPLSDLGNEAETGFHLQGSLGLQVPLLPVGVRADLLWQRFPDEHSGNFTAIGGMLNATLRMPFPIVRPYLIGGIGSMRHSEPDEDHGEGGTSTEFAYGLGAGVQLTLLGFGGFAEARVLDWGHGNRSIPLTIGIIF